MIDKVLSFHSQRSTTFSVRALGDAEVPNINDMKLLPGCLIVLADSKNKYVKLYDRQVRFSVLRPTVVKKSKRK